MTVSMVMAVKTRVLSNIHLQTRHCILHHPSHRPLRPTLPAPIALLDPDADASEVDFPSRLRSRLLGAAPLTHALLLLIGWLVALYVLPGHPATPGVRLSLVVSTPVIPVFFFVQHRPRAATRWASAVLAAFVLATLPHAAGTLGQRGAFDGVALPLTLSPCCSRRGR